ncbi:hypothetical protein B0T26DRAFT_673675 [Lasiosphaeria miniovina]|uniref:Uncharacterized protein n=1 Tax=Lasiosphaeria miniovina TaxID=1954250 RepID=A0AA40E2L8_9PEZI|nr:uncharacterized protein B0T26DRAFT_673675 [Lasiosphaeria miniovina]KAK0721911.1 hypothetical protein B0T26DRAFT_673675 [Lasiosphaeria miniovina]
MSTMSYELKEVHELREALENFEDNTGESLNFNFDGKECNWDNVLAELKRALEADEERAKNGITKHELYVVHGGLTIIFGVDELLRRQQSLQDTLDAISGKNGLFQFVVEMLNNPRLNMAPPPEYTPAVYPPARANEKVLTALELLNLLDIQLLGPIEEETQILRRGSSIDDAPLSRASFRTLLFSQQPGVVLVDACSDRAQGGSSVTPVSVICATLTQALRRGGYGPALSLALPTSASTSVILVFFCGLHIATEDPLRGPLGLVRSLLAQLALELLKNRWVTEEGPMGVLPDESMEEGLYLADLCGLFHNLLQLVPAGTSVYCIVDGISSYEREFWSEDYGVVMGAFARIVRDEGLEAWFKLLMTGLASSPGLDRWMPHQRVSVGSGRVGGGSVQRAMRAAFRDVNLNDDYY